MVNNGITEKGGVFALGNFDGVHRGHRLVVNAAVAQAQAMDVPARVLTFEPHPRAVFQSDAPPFRLTPFAVKERLLKEYGIDEVLVCPFTYKFAQMEAQDFVKRILLERFGAKHIVAGHDFVFGHHRVGTMHKLAAWLAPHEVEVTEIAPLGDVDTNAFSATRIRQFLQMGKVADALEMLGHDWSISGTVVKGEQRGRTIGVPTANIGLGEYLRPKFGVYAVRAGKTGQPLTHRGVANIGSRPTVGGDSENLEAHLFDFNQDIYGQEWEFALTRFIRPERKFDSLDELKVQIAKDIEAAKQG